MTDFMSRLHEDIYIKAQAFCYPKKITMFLGAQEQLSDEQNKKSKVDRQYSY